jgi:hypothetical protein
LGCERRRTGAAQQKSRENERRQSHSAMFDGGRSLPVENS